MDLADPLPNTPPTALRPNEEGFIPYRRTGETLRVRIAREPWLPWFQLYLADGTSEELDPEETRKWFHLRGANMDTLERALDYVWNFYGRQKYVWVEVKDPIEVSLPRRSLADPVL